MKPTAVIYYSIRELFADADALYNEFIEVATGRFSWGDNYASLVRAEEIGNVLDELDDEFNEIDIVQERLKSLGNDALIDMEG